MIICWEKLLKLPSPDLVNPLKKGEQSANEGKSQWNLWEFHGRSLLWSFVSFPSTWAPLNVQQRRLLDWPLQPNLETHGSGNTWACTKTSINSTNMDGSCLRPTNLLTFLPTPRSRGCSVCLHRAHIDSACGICRHAILRDLWFFLRATSYNTTPSTDAKGCFGTLWAWKYTSCIIVLALFKDVNYLGHTI